MARLGRVRSAPPRFLSGRVQVFWRRKVTDFEWGVRAECVRASSRISFAGRLAERGLEPSSRCLWLGVDRLVGCRLLGPTLPHALSRRARLSQGCHLTERTVGCPLSASADPGLLPAASVCVSWLPAASSSLVGVVEVAVSTVPACPLVRAAPALLEPPRYSGAGAHDDQIDGRVGGRT
jgi:hypothetical protein